MQKSNTYLEDIQINNILVMNTLAGTHFKHKPADNLEHGIKQLLMREPD